MLNELSNGKMLYAYLKVMDPNTSLPKSVLINWVCTKCLLSNICLQFVYFSIAHSWWLLIGMLYVLQSGGNVPTSVKGVCANHVPQVSKFFPVQTYYISVVVILC